MKKRMISVLLVVAMLCSMLVLSVQAQNAESTVMIPADQMEKRFVVDGNLDIWYLNEDDAVAAGDKNYYQYSSLIPIEKSDGVSYFAAPETFAQAWTAWDDEYVYVYVKVWDDDLIAYDPSGAHAGMDSSAADSVGIFFDPDPNSQTHTYIYDDNGNIIEEVKKAPEDVKDNFFKQTDDPAQGDVQFRWRPLEDKIDDYYNVVKPGYNGVSFSEYINNTENLATFTFQNEPIIIEETGVEVSSGYGMEVRFPRHNDKSNRYRFHIYASNSSDEMWQRYVLTTGNAWWMRYDNAWNVGFVKNAPFFNQSEEQLATKGVMYTDSKANLNGPAGKVVEKIKALGNVTAADKDKVLALKAEYEALTGIERGYVEYKDCLEPLKAALAVVGIDDDIAPPDNANQKAADAVIAQINALNVQSLDDEPAVVAARAAYDALTDEQKALVTNLAKLVAAEDKIEKAPVEKTPVTITVSSAEATPGDIIPVSISVSGESNIGGLFLELPVPTAYLESATVLNDRSKLVYYTVGAASINAGATFEVSNGCVQLSDGGTGVQVAISTSEGLWRAGELVTVYFKVLKPLPESGLELNCKVNEIADINGFLCDYDVTIVPGIIEPPCAAEKTMEIIDQIPDEITLNDEEIIVAARAAYDALTDEHKARVTNLEKLENAEAELSRLKEEAQEKEASDKAVAQIVINLINNLPDPIELTDENMVAAVRLSFNNLTDDQKQWVPNLSKLENAEKEIEQLKKTAAEKEENDKAVAQIIINLITALPDSITIENESMVISVRMAYDNLTDDQKTLVANADKLFAAEKTIEQLKKPMVYGDVDGDGKVTATDALEVLKSVVGKVDLTDEQNTAADTDGNGKADAADALNILKKVVGKIDKFPVEIA